MCAYICIPPTHVHIRTCTHRAAHSHLHIRVHSHRSTYAHAHVLISAPPGATHAQSCVRPRSPSQAAWRMDLAAPLRVALPGFGLGSTASACSRPPNSLRWLFSPLPPGGKPICPRLPWTQGLGRALPQAGNPWSRCPQGSSLPSECVALDAPAALLHLSG